MSSNDYAPAVKQSNYRQTMAMFNKNFILKKRQTGQVLWEFLFPAMLIGYLRVLLYNPCVGKDADCTEKEINQAFATQGMSNAIVFTIIVPGVFGMGQKFVIQNMVDDKQTKMRQSLKIMSLSDFSYGFSIILTQSIFALGAGFFLGLGMLQSTATFPDDPILNPL